MSKGHTPQLLIAVMALSVIGVMILTIWLLYDTNLEQQRMRLVESVQSSARMIETIAEHEGKEDTLKQLRNAHATFRGFGDSGEFTLAQLQEEQIEFLLSHRNSQLATPQAIPLNSPLAEPMRRALGKESGVLIGLDYSGVEVMAAYEPVAHMGWGVVAKIDMAEIRAPFLNTGIVAALLAALIVILGSIAITRLILPLLEKLREEHEYQRTLFKNSPIGLVLCQMDGTYVDANPAFEKIIGRPLDELKTLSYWDITPGRYAESEAEQLEQLNQHGEYGPYEKEYIHRDGYMVPIRLFGKVVHRNGNKYILSSAEDITDRVCAEGRLRQAATIFETTDEGIIITDENNRIIMVNSAFSNITGYSEEEALGNNPRLLRSDKHDNNFYDRLWHRLEVDGNWRGEMWNRRKDGTLFPVWQQIAVIRDKLGKVENYVSIFSDISEFKVVEQQLAHIAHHDELTGLPNRLYFKIQIEKCLQQAKRNQHRMALLFLDLDGFKQINDNFGHDVGDQLLKEVARRLQTAVREEDTVARMGGDEFIIILNQISNHEDAALVADNIMKDITRPIVLPQQTLNPSTSIGIGVYPDNGESVDELQKAADNAMYLAKEAGKNTYKFFTQQV